MIKYKIQDRNRLIIDMRFNGRFSRRTRRFIDDNIYNNMQTIILVDNIIFWDLLWRYDLYINLGGEL